MRGRSSGVEHNLAKVGVEGSNPFARSKSANSLKLLISAKLAFSAYTGPLAIACKLFVSVPACASYASDEHCSRSAKLLISRSAAGRAIGGA